MVPDEQRGDAHDAGAGRQAREFFERLWAEGDQWGLETAELDQRRYARQLALITDRRYRRALELGCGAGSFTRHLSPVCDTLLALDIAESAIARARDSGARSPNVDFRAHRLHAATESGGRLLLVNTSDAKPNGLLSAWLIRTYHDLFANVGYQLEAEETMRGAKDGVRLEILLSRFGKVDG